MVKKAKVESRVRGGGINLRDYGLIAALVVIILFFQIWSSGRLLYAANINNLIMQNAYVMILAIGMVMVIIAGHIDLSVGSAVAMIGGLVAVAISSWGWAWPLAIVLALAVGAVMGAWQGFWVAFVGIPGFIVTLAGMLMFRGFALVFLHGGTIGGLGDGFNAVARGWLPHWMGEFGKGKDLLTVVIGIVAVVGMVVAQVRSRSQLKSRGLARTPLWIFLTRNIVIGGVILWLAYTLAGHKGTPYVLILLAVLILAYTFVLNRTVFGRHIYAMGGNRFAAIMSGVKTKWVDFFLFVNIGVLTAVAAVVTTARAGSAVATAGDFFELDAIAAVFIGGAAVQGGVGKISGAVTGALIMGVLNQGLSIMGVLPEWTKVIKGLVLLAAVAFDVTNRRRAGDR
jgi:putative multiple sugar transport system permease protein